MEARARRDQRRRSRRARRARATSCAPSCATSAAARCGRRARRGPSRSSRALAALLDRDDATRGGRHDRRARRRLRHGRDRAAPRRNPARRHRRAVRRTRGPGGRRGGVASSSASSRSAPTRVASGSTRAALPGAPRRRRTSSSARASPRARWSCTTSSEPADALGSVRRMTATDADLTASDVVWDLEPLLPAPGDAGLDAAARRGRRDGRRARGARTARSRRLDADGLVDVHARARRAARPHRPRRAATSGLDFATDTTDPARGARMQTVEERSTAISTKLLFFELEWAELPDDQVEALLADERLAFAAHHLRSARRYRPHLLTEPEEVVLTEKSMTGRSAWERLFDEQMSASPSSSTARRPRSKPALARLHAPDRDVRAAAAAAVTEGLAARAAHAGVRAQHAARRQVDRRPAAPLRRLDREPQPLQRGERRVGAGARRRGAGPLLDPAALVHAEGAAARHRPARRLRPHGVGRRRRERKSAGTSAKELVLDAYGSFSGELADTAQQFFDERVDRRAGAAGQATGRVLRVHRAVAPPVPVAQLDVAPPRRAHARARARPRPARVPRARAGRVPPDDAAHARRDRVGVRRDRHVRPAARRGDRSRTSGSRCSRRTSRIRSPPCSARSR